MRQTTSILALVAALATAPVPALAGDAPAPRAAAASAEKTTKQDATIRTAEQAAALRKSILDGLADARYAPRAAAGDLLVATWPASEAILDEALASTNAGVRYEATCALGRAELGDQKDRIRRRFADVDESVRRQAVRIARHLDWPQVEPDFVAIVARDAAWVVRQEALRGLVDVGTLKCARVVLEGMAAEKDEERRARYKRVLVKVLSADFGTDTAAWRDAIEKAEAVERSKRK